MAHHNSERSKKEATLKRLKDELGGRGRSGKTPADADRTALQARIDTLTQEIADHSARAYATHSVLRPLPGYEFIPQGTRLTQNLTLTPRQPHGNRRLHRPACANSPSIPLLVAAPRTITASCQHIGRLPSATVAATI